MATRTRVRLYKGILQADAEERFRADAVWALREGWRPASWHWDGVALRVTYQFDGQRPAAVPGARGLVSRVRLLARAHRG